MLEMPGNRLALAIRVSCQKDLLTLFGRSLQVRNNAFFPLHRDILWFEICLQIHPQLTLGQVSQVPHTGFDLIIRPQIFSNGLRLGRRLDNDKIFSFRHCSSPDTIYKFNANSFPGCCVTIPFTSRSVRDAKTPAGVISLSAIKSSTCFCPSRRSSARVLSSEVSV